MGETEKPKENEEKAGKNRKGKMALLVFAALLIAGGIVGFFIYRYKLTHITTDDAYIKGTVYTVSPKVPGTVLAVYVEDNQFVRKGDLLVRINPERFEVALGGARANLEAVKRALGEAKAKVKALEAAVALAEAQRAQAKLDYKRAKALYKKGAIPKSKFDRAKTAFDVAGSAVEAKRAELDAARAGIKTLKARVDAALAAVRDAELKLSYTFIKAPGDGYVTRKNVEEGNFVGPGQPLMAIVSTEDLWVEANYKETQLTHMKVGDPAIIRIDTYPDREFKGKIESIMAGTGSEFSLFPPENATGNYVKVVQRIPVKIVFTEKVPEDVKLRVGMSVVPTVIVTR